MSEVRTVTRELYVVLVKNRRYWRTPAIDRTTLRSPKLKAGELAVKVSLRIPENIFDLPAAELTIDPSNLIRPEVKAS
jgi:hypothetical protein